MQLPISCPAVLISAPASGQGKTTVTSAWARLLTRRGIRVSVFKCGPDFLDPFWHELASGRSVHQLDLWITAEADIARRLYQAAQCSDLILIEGVMGLFDGQPSAADLAQKFNIPVLTVIDASAMAGTFGALAFGLKHYRPELPWAGVLANRVASDRHAQMLQDVIQDKASWWGALARNDALKLPERDLGLTVAAELPDALQRLDAAADALQATRLGQMDLSDFQAWSVRFEPPEPTEAAPALLDGKTIAVARDAAFCFVYPANLDALQSMGARLTFFSPLAGDALPECDAVWLPGGYPELHAQVLASNTRLKQSLLHHAQQNRAIWAECGGMMALFERLTLKDGSSFEMWGLLRGQVVMQNKLAALGPHALTLQGQTLRGHTFHYSRIETDMPVLTRTARADAPEVCHGEAFYQQDATRASYFHPWFASNLQATALLFQP